MYYLHFYLIARSLICSCDKNINICLICAKLITNGDLQSEHIKEHFSRTVPRILKAKNLTKDAFNAEFEISIKNDYVVSPEKITLSVGRVSDKKVLQQEESFRIGKSAGSSWYPNRSEMLNELLSYEELRAL
jgi:hypothetical protein